MLRTFSSSPLAARQRGVVLVIALIVLVGLTLAGLALMRSVDMTNIIAGNMAFQQAATQAADTGTEAAVTWLEANNTGTFLHSDQTGYSATVQNPSGTQTWDNFWVTVLAQRSPLPLITTMTADASMGNTVAYSIQRLCASAGDPTAPSTRCTLSQSAAASTGSSMGAGVVAFQYNGQVLYRITTRVSGPRNAVSYIQTIIAL